MELQPDYHKIKEFPLHRENVLCPQYAVGQLWSVAEASKHQTGGGEGVEVLVNEPFDQNHHAPPVTLQCNGRTFTRGQYSRKIYHVGSKVPSWFRVFVPPKYTQLIEEAWNAYPYTRTVITNPSFMGNNFYIIIESYHAPDHGKTPNIHGLLGAELENRKVVLIDVANDPVSPKEYDADFDPCLVGCPIAHRQPIPKDGTGAWMAEARPVMCCYKLVKVWFKWFGIQRKVESFIMDQERRLFFLFHRQLICWQQNYHNLNMEVVRKIEDETAKDLKRRRTEDALRGWALDE